MATERLPCKICNTVVLPSTLAKTGGVCMPCYNAQLVEIKSRENKCKLLKLLALYQAGAAVIIFLLLMEDAFLDPSYIELNILLAVVTLNGSAAFLLSKNNIIGIFLTYFNLILQLVTINTGSFYYSYVGIASVYLTISEGFTIGIGAIIDPGYLILVGGQRGETSYGIDVIAVTILVLLFKSTDYIKQQFNYTLSKE